MYVHTLDFQDPGVLWKILLPLQGVGLGNIFMENNQLPMQQVSPHVISIIQGRDSFVPVLQEFLEWDGKVPDYFQYSTFRVVIII